MEVTRQDKRYFLLTIAVFFVGLSLKTRLKKSTILAPTPTVETRRDFDVPDEPLAFESNDDENNVEADATVTSQNQTHHSCLIGDNLVELPKTPHFLIVGTQKGGTSAISKLLDVHPAMQKSDKFEPHFFDFMVTNHWPKEFWSTLSNATKKAYFKGRIPFNRDDDQVCRLRQQYHAKYFGNYAKKLDSNILSSARPIYSFEKTPGYLPHPMVPGLIKLICGPSKPKLLVVLRNPVERAYSSYKMLKNVYAKKENLTSFEQVLRRDLQFLQKQHLVTAPLPPIPTADDDSVENYNSEQFTQPIVNDTTILQEIVMTPFRRSPLYVSMYALHLRNWLNHFSLVNPSTHAKPFSLKVVRFEELKENRLETMREILSFVMGPDGSEEDLDYFSRGNRSELLERNLSPNGGVQKNQKNYHTPMPAHLEKYLYRFYKPYNDQLADLLGEKWRDVWQYTGDESI